MNLHLTGHHLDVTPALREYLTSKLERITRHFDQVTDVAVVLSVEREQRNAEATVHVRGKDLFAECQDPDMYAAIDGLIDKLDRQIVKHKEKLASGRTDGGLKHSDPDTY